MKVYKDPRIITKIKTGSRRWVTRIMGCLELQRGQVRKMKKKGSNRLEVRKRGWFKNSIKYKRLKKISKWRSMYGVKDGLVMRVGVPRVRDFKNL